MDTMESDLLKRFRQVRKHLGYNQAEFAARVGLTQAGLSMLELGKNKLTEKNIKHFCTTFSINEQWLRTGEGEMFGPVSPYEKELLEKFGRLPNQMQEVMIDIARSMAKRTSPPESAD